MENLIAQAREIKITPEEKQEAELKAQVLKPGDLILVQTPSYIYAAFRNIGYSSYDHIAVVIDDQYSLHISYPRAKKVPTTLFTHKQKVPLIIRPKFTEEQRQEFINNLLLEALGKPYDAARVAYALISSRIYDLGKYNDTKNEKIVCSHQIFRSLTYAKPSLMFNINEDTTLEYHSFGTFTLQDFVKVADSNQEFFMQFPLYSKNEIDIQKLTNINIAEFRDKSIKSVK